MPTPSQTLLGQAQLDIGRSFGIGGDQWAGERTSGDGEVTPIVTQTLLDTAYVRQVKPPQVQATADAINSDTDWIMAAPMGADIQAGDLRWSVVDPTLRFQVLNVDTTRGVIRATVERVSNGNA